MPYLPFTIGWNQSYESILIFMLLRFWEIGRQKLMILNFYKIFIRCFLRFKVNKIDFTKKIAFCLIKTISVVEKIVKIRNSGLVFNCRFILDVTLQPKRFSPTAKFGLLERLNMQCLRLWTMIELILLDSCWNKVSTWTNFSPLIE